ncbi:hypothetical protein, partial [Escherichia coli]|uniref:hypothetical protein n=1 Tax=Escherichia coli TaxID=562 RepID=UPI001BE47669
ENLTGPRAKLLEQTLNPFKTNAGGNYLILQRMIIRDVGEIEQTHLQFMSVVMAPSYVDGHVHGGPNEEGRRILHWMSSRIFAELHERRVEMVL